MDHAELLATLKRSTPDSTMGARLVPTSFDPHDAALRGFPIALDWQWSGSERFIRSCVTAGVMMRLPLFWQLEVPLREAGARAGVFIFVSDRGNMPLAAEALRSAEISCIVTDVQDFFDFSTYLKQKSKIESPSWLIVHPGAPSELTFDRVGGERHAHEVHLFPGVPVLEQCEVLQSKSKPEFHFLSDISWDKRSNTITMTSEGPLQLRDYALPFAITETRQCVCGRPVMSPSPR